MNTSLNSFHSRITVLFFVFLKRQLLEFWNYRSSWTTQASVLLKLLPETSLSWRERQFTSNIKSITVLKKSSPKSWNLSGGEGDGVEGRSVVTGRWKQTQNQSSTLRNTNITPYATGNAACKAHVGTKEKAPAYITHVDYIRKADQFCQTNPLDQKWLEITASLPTQVFQTAGKG